MKTKEIFYTELLWNIPFNTLSALLKLPTNTLADREPYRTLVYKLMNEVRNVAAKDEIQIEEEFLLTLIAETAEKEEPYYSSMFYDLTNGQPLEPEETVTAFLNKAKALNVDIPIFDFIQTRLTSDPILCLTESMVREILGTSPSLVTLMHPGQGLSVQVKEKLKVVYASDRLYKKIDVLIELYDWLLISISNDEITQPDKELLEQVTKLLQYYFNINEKEAGEEKALSNAIELRKSHQNIQPSISTMPHKETPVGNLLFSESPASRQQFKEWKKQKVVAAQEAGVVRAQRSACAAMDYQYGGDQAEKAEKDERQIFPCSARAGYVQFRINISGNLEVIPFTSNLYCDSSGANGYSMFAMDTNGSIRVASRRGFPSVKHGAPSRFHSSLTNGKPVISAGLITITNGKYVYGDFSGHYMSSLRGLKLFALQLKQNGLLTKDTILLHNIRCWPASRKSGLLLDATRINIQGVRIDIDKLLTLSNEELILANCVNQKERQDIMHLLEKINIPHEMSCHFGDNHNIHYQKLMLLIHYVQNNSMPRELTELNISPKLLNNLNMGILSFYTADEEKNMVATENSNTKLQSEYNNYNEDLKISGLARFFYKPPGAALDWNKAPELNLYNHNPVCGPS